MEYYFYLNAQNERKCPVPAADLLRNGITRTTLVWKEGMAQWLPAGEIPELQNFFTEASIPPIPPINPPETPPVPSQSAPGMQKPDNLLVWSILTTVLCSLPLGVVAIIYSTKVDNLWNVGKYQEAEKAAATAKTFCWISFGLGIVGGIIGFITGLMGALLGA